MGAITRDLEGLTDQHKNDFLMFEGNAQTLRVVTKLQVIGDDLGLNLTLGTLASLMKYVAPSTNLTVKGMRVKRSDSSRRSRPLYEAYELKWP
jgi:dGTP triphosphohydrolase